MRTVEGLQPVIQFIQEEERLRALPHPVLIRPTIEFDRYLSAYKKGLLEGRIIILCPLGKMRLASPQTRPSVEVFFDHGCVIDLSKTVRTDPGKTRIAIDSAHISVLQSEQDLVYVCLVDNQNNLSSQFLLLPPNLRSVLDQGLIYDSRTKETSFLLQPQDEEEETKETKAASPTPTLKEKTIWPETPEQKIAKAIESHDPQVLETIASHLETFAEPHTPKEGKITVNIERSENRVQKIFLRYLGFSLNDFKSWLSQGALPKNIVQCFLHPVVSQRWLAVAIKTDQDGRIVFQIKTDDNPDPHSQKPITIHGLEQNPIVLARLLTCIKEKPVAKVEDYRQYRPRPKEETTERREVPARKQRQTNYHMNWWLPPH